MPKMKSHKASKRRIRITPTGKILRTQCGVRHLLTHRSPKRLRNLGKKTTSRASLETLTSLLARCAWRPLNHPK
jgi:large subunit ribosomal protein L35